MTMKKIRTLEQIARRKEILDIARSKRKFDKASRERMSKSQLNRFKDKSKHPRWKGGKILSRGYVYSLSPEHPFKNLDGYVLEHRLIMEKHIGRTLLPMEIVHHINGDKEDNRIENLMLFNSKKEHNHIHKLIRKNDKTI